MKKNCWEFKECGRGPQGYRTGKQGVCPAATQKKLNGVHDGINGGRSCWMVPGTACEETLQGKTDEVFTTCTDCDFYQLVKKEEQPSFVFSGKLFTDFIK